MIAIKKFIMPEDCHSCPMSVWVYDSCTCILTGRHFQELKKRHHSCPLYEDGCDTCEFKHRCTRRPVGGAVIFDCEKFKKEEN